MIDPKELRIGNRVYADAYGSRQEICINEIHEKSARYGNGMYLDLSLCSGIPLSPEVLSACGFGGKYKSCGYNFRKDGVFLTTQEEDEEGNEIEDYVFHVQLNHGYEGIYYLHQLQNLYFALTGEELTYNPNQP